MRSTAARPALSVAVAIVLLVSIVAFAAPPAVAQEGGSGHTTFAIDLRLDGDARFTVTLQLELESEEEVEAFDQLQEDHVTGSSSPLSVRPFERASTGASDVTGREMVVRDVSRSGSLENRTGRLAVSFTWTNFSDVSDDRLVLGDAFRTPSGTWLPQLGPDQELVITFPEGYQVQSVSRPLRNGTIHVEGPASFEPGRPSAVLAGSPGSGPEELLPLVAGIAILVLVLSALLYYFWYRERAPAAPGGASDTVGNGGGAVDGAAESADVADDPLLSDEERVLRLLQREGGRMKQVDIVEATDWSNAKVSQLLSEMAEDGRIDKLRIGRENLISLPGQGPGGQ